MKKDKNKKQRIREKRNLSILNLGDKVVIKNKSAVAGAVLGSIILSFLAVLLFVLRDAWDVWTFWAVFAFVTLSTAYMLSNAIFGKIVLDSPKKTMTVYFPFKLEYKFEDINYIDLSSSKPKDGIVTHKVSVYIGKGNRCANITSTSLSQAKELASLLGGMLDNGAMEYPEFDGEPTVTDEEPARNEKKKSALSLFGKRKKADGGSDEGEEFTPIKKESTPTEATEGDASDTLWSEGTDA